MAQQYLDKIGLAYLWGKIKQYVRTHSTDVSLDQVYPVGSVYMNINEVNPGTLFGGTWVSIEHPFVYPSNLIFPDDDLYPSYGYVVHAWKRVS